jgi:hypothetical protein
MHVDDTHPDAAASPAGGPRSGRAPISRRQAIGRLSALATAGAAAWVVPEILTAKPAAGAVALSQQPTTGPVSSGSDGPTGSGVTTAAATTSGVTTAASTAQPSGPTSGVTTAATTQPSLAYSGLNIERDTEIGAALVAGGWALHHWASRTPKPTADGRIVGGSAGDPS